MGLYERNTLLAFGEIKNSIDDLKFARIGYNEGYYHKSINNIQESIEKSGKSYGFFVGAIDQNIAQKSVGHRLTNLYFLSNEYYLELIGHVENKIDFFKLSEFLSHLSTDNDGSPISNSLFDKSSHEKIFDFEKEVTEENFRDVSDADLKTYLEYINRELSIFCKIIDLFSNSKSNQSIIQCFKSLGRKKMRSISRSSYKIRIKFPSRSYYYFRNASDTEIIQYLEFVATSIYCLKVLFLLACLTQYHQSFTRYCDQNGIVPRDIYTIDHPLVKNFIQLASIVEIVSSTLNNFYFKYKDYDLKF